MPLTNEELERLENEYLREMHHKLKSDKDRLMNGLRSKNRIRDDWLELYKLGGKGTDMDRGAERIFYWLLSGVWTPNSAPIGSNLFFETHNAFIHIEVKTARINNTADFKGLVPIGKRQTTYEPHESWKGTRITTEPGLPKYYNKGKENEKVCLTYAIQVIHDPETFEVLAILLISIPNGQLYSLYGSEIVNAGKNKGESFRYRYKGNPYFESLAGRHYRVKFLYFDESSQYSKEFITAGSVKFYG